jgi:hypothetical protein
MAIALQQDRVSSGQRNQPFWRRDRRLKEAVMISFVEFAEITGAVLAAFALAVGLEWLGLYGLTRFMPGRRNLQGGQSH